MLTIDGAAGGGQLLRTALCLSIITDTPFRIDDIRGSRPNPGLRPQHLAAVDLAADYCDGTVEGAELDADSLTFRPGSARRTSLEANVGTAGSITLLFDTLLPIAAASDEPFELIATGGTDVKWAPPIDYYRWVKAPLLAAVGVTVDVDVRKTGYYPVGDGEAILRVSPSSPTPIEIERRGELERIDIYSKASEALAEPRVADRQATRAREALADAGFRTDIASVEYVPTRSTGSSLLLRGVYENALVGFDALGERGRTSERVADGAVRRFTAFHATDAPIDAFMADQLMLFLALAGGRLRIPAATAHVRTNLDLIAAFGTDMHLDRREDGTFTLEVMAPMPIG
ncbi:RNA 3'-terminal phosphate cyclase (plasmid) [Haloferacaceae archaeon DSL9]